MLLTIEVSFTFVFTVFTLWLTVKVFELTATFLGALVFVYGYGPSTTTSSSLVRVPACT